MDIIYADELFALNFLMDYLLLLSAARLRGAPLYRGRFALSAAVGGVYAVAAAIPGHGWLTTAAVKLAVSALMAWLAYKTDNYLTAWLWFLALSAGFGGAVFAAALLAGQQPQGVVVTITGRILLLSVGVCYGLVRLFFGRFLQRRERVILPVTITLGTRRVRLMALRDTGNALHDPVTGRHVMVADPAAVAALFPPEALGALLLTDPTAQLEALSALPGLTGRFRLIPYTAVGTRQGLLVCFRPDGLLVENRREDLLTALSPTPLSDGGDYSAVL